ncbi:MAG TPA: TIGR03668 family PPOX class F420-dependent oxidoreductase [Acidimicrobiia bacterium]|nr:TIGR03668 family PPOX class F420-dependent oxidoreductase [Acidimicrobiia bacterium]
MESSRAWELLKTAAVAVLGTVNQDGSVHLVPFTYVTIDGPDPFLVSAIDEKPKRGRDLRRLDNIHRDPRVTILAHHYEADWSRLWWVRATGSATVWKDPPAAAQRALIDKYPDYEEQVLGPWIIIRLDRISGWSSIE